MSVTDFEFIEKNEIGSLLYFMTPAVALMLAFCLILRRGSLRAAHFVQDDAERIIELTRSDRSAVDKLIAADSKSVARLFTTSDQIKKLLWTDAFTAYKLIKKHPHIMARLFQSPELLLSLRTFFPLLPSLINSELHKEFASDNGDNIVIIGLGPTGLAAALAACESALPQAKIIALTNRSEYDRAQIFRVDDNVKAYISALCGYSYMAQHERDGHIYSVRHSGNTRYTGPAPYHVVQTQRLEHILLERLRSFGNRVEIIKVEKNYQPNVDVVRHILTLPGGREVRFKYLLGADGAHHSTANVLQNKGVNISYRMAHKNPLHPRHAIGSYVLPENSEIAYRMALDLRTPYIESDAPTASMQRLGWKLRSLPEYRVFVVESTLYIGTEAPSTISPRANDINSWLLEVLRTALPAHMVNSLSFKLTHDASPACGVFDVALREANKIMFTLPKLAGRNDAYFIQLGDALRTTHYHTGSGVGLALLEVQAWGEFLASRQQPLDRQEMEHRIENIIRTNVARVDSYLHARARREFSAPIPRASRFGIFARSYFQDRKDKVENDIRKIVRPAV